MKVAAKSYACPLCGEAHRSLSHMRRHQKDCHMQPGRKPEPLHFGDLTDQPFTIKSPYGGRR